MSVQEPPEERGKGDVRGIEALVTEERPRLIHDNGGSLRATLPRMHANHVGLGAGGAFHASLHTGATPVTIDEPCIIIRPANAERSP